MVNYRYIGTVTHYFDRIGVAVIRLDEDLYLGDWVLIEGPRTEFEQEVRSLQIEHEPIEHAVPGDEVALKVDVPVRAHDEVFLIYEE